MARCCRHARRAGLLLLLITASVLVAHAGTPKIQELKQQKKATQQKKQQVLTKLREVRQQQKAISVQIEEGEQEVARARRELLRIQRDLQRTERELAQAEQECQAAEERCRLYRAQVWQRLVAFYKSGHSGYLSILLDVQTFADLLNRTYFFQQLAQRDQNRLAELRAERERVKQLRASIAQRKTDLLRLKSEQQKHQEVIRRRLAEKRELMASIDRDEKAYERNLAECQADERRIEALIRRLSQPLPSKWRGSGTYLHPVRGSITSRFGMRRHPILKRPRFHNGIDFAAPYGSAIRVVDHGRVISVGRQGGYGLTVIVDHGNGLQTLYGHCSSLLVRAGQQVRRGQVIARVGNTGLSTGSHLHFTVYRGGKAINPTQVLR